MLVSSGRVGGGAGWAETCLLGEVSAGATQLLGLPCLGPFLGAL